MNIEPIERFLWGGTFALYGSAALFFLLFWKRTRDRLFGGFGMALLLLGIERLTLLLVPHANEFRPYIYLVRLAAFSLILAAIVDKNRHS